MKKNLFFVSAITIATLASCSQESMLDPTVVSVQNSQTPIEFSTYASTATATRGTAVNSNSDFQSVHASFDVTALVSDAEFDQYYEDAKGYGAYTSFSVSDIATGYADKYFNFSNVTYSNGSWLNTNQMYWPNDSRVLYFAAYSPASTNISTETDSDGNGYTFSAYTNSSDNQSYKFIFPYTVSDEIDEQVDLMYAMTRCDYLSPADRERLAADLETTYSYVTDGTDYTNTEESVNLHFKHALTQIAFTATKDADIDVYVHSITICNVYNSGTFTAKALTDDEDTSDNSSDGSTVGDTTADGDLVNAGNFGTWATTFDADGWSSGLYASATNEYAFYTKEGHSSMSNYEATLVDLDVTSPVGLASIQLGEGVTALTSSDEVLMLMPQKLTAWVPTTSTVINYVGFTTADDTSLNFELSDGNTAVSTESSSLSYLAIDCEIYHKGIADEDAVIHDGYIFVPFETKDIAYNSATVDNVDKNADEWLAGYKITYCLNFGGGYVVEEGHADIIPEPGCIPDTETYTLRTITYTTSVDTWIDVEQDQDLMDFDNAVDKDTSYDEPVTE